MCVSVCVRLHSVCVYCLIYVAWSVFCFSCRCPLRGSSCRPPRGPIPPSWLSCRQWDSQIDRLTLEVHPYLLHLSHSVPATLPLSLILPDLSCPPSCIPSSLIPLLFLPSYFPPSLLFFSSCLFSLSSLPPSLSPCHPPFLSLEVLSCQRVMPHFPFSSHFSAALIDTGGDLNAAVNILLR